MTELERQARSTMIMIAHYLNIPVEMAIVVVLMLVWIV